MGMLSFDLLPGLGGGVPQFTVEKSALALLLAGRQLPWKVPKKRLGQPCARDGMCACSSAWLPHDLWVSECRARPLTPGRGDGHSGSEEVM